MKTLAIKFKYLGDVVVMTPSLRALRADDPHGELHVLVPEESAPLLEHLSYIDKVWRLPRRRGRINPLESLPIIKQLRKEGFDRSVDFVGNDRGALWSLAIGAKQRLGLDSGGGFLGRPKCFHETAPLPPYGPHEAERDFTILKPWHIAAPDSFALEMRADPSLALWAEEVMPDPVVLCHLSTSQPKKEWPVQRWAELAGKAGESRQRLFFSSGASPRERKLLEELRQLRPEVEVLPAMEDLGKFLAVLARAKGFVSGDTGPLHFAAGLGLPTLCLFGPSIAGQWAPRGEKHLCLKGSSCSCSVHAHACGAVRPCMAGIEVEAVWQAVGKLLAEK